MAQKFTEIKLPNLSNVHEILADKNEQEILESKWIRQDAKGRPVSVPKQTYADIVKQHNIKDLEREETKPEWIDYFLAKNPAYTFENGVLKEKSIHYNVSEDKEEKECELPPPTSIFFSN